MKEKSQTNDELRTQTQQTTKKSPKELLKKMKGFSLSAIPWRSVGRWTLRFIRRNALKIGCFFLCVVVLVALMAFTLSLAVQDEMSDRIITQDALISMDAEFDYILILGCGVYPDGSLTPMLSDRVRVGVSLYQQGIGNQILMSGDHYSDDYNEVDPMKDTAISMGVPAEAIVTDPYGLSTYDSIARLADVFGAKRVLIVTQEYHLPRALYLSKRFGIEAFGVAADLRPYREQLLYDIREMFARCKDVVYAEVRPAAASPIS